MVTRTGLESAPGHVATGTYETWPGDISGGFGPRSGAPICPDAAADASRCGPDASLPSPVPSFLEACGRLAAEAAARGDFDRARELIEKAARVAALEAHGAGGVGT